MGFIEVVSFDMEGTLVDPSFSNLIWENDIPCLYAKERGISFKAAKEQVMKEYMEVGEDRPEWYDVGYWFRRLRLSGDWRDLLEHRRDVIRAYPETRGVLERLSDKYVLIVTSNTIREFLEAQLVDLGDFFAHIFSAPSDFGEVKKSAEFYGRICRITETKPGAMAHVGDHPRFDYEAPRRLGIHAYHLSRSKEDDGEHIVYDLDEFERKLEMLENPSPRAE